MIIFYLKHRIRSLPSLKPFLLMYQFQGSDEFE